MGNGPVYLFAMALTCIMSVTPLSTFNTPSYTSAESSVRGRRAVLQPSLTGSVACVGDAIWASAAAFFA